MPGICGQTLRIAIEIRTPRANPWQVLGAQHEPRLDSHCKHGVRSDRLPSASADRQAARRIRTRTQIFVEQDACGAHTYTHLLIFGPRARRCIARLLGAWNLHQQGIAYACLQRSGRRADSVRLRRSAPKTQVSNHRAWEIGLCPRRPMPNRSDHLLGGSAAVARRGRETTKDKNTGRCADGAGPSPGDAQPRSLPSRSRPSPASATSSSGLTKAGILGHNAGAPSAMKVRRQLNGIHCFGVPVVLPALGSTSLNTRWRPQAYDRCRKH